MTLRTNANHANANIKNDIFFFCIKYIQCRTFLRTYLSQSQSTVIGTMTIVRMYSIEKFKIILVLPSVRMP